jgi:hypothetical protein
MLERRIERDVRSRAEKEDHAVERLVVAIWKGLESSIHKCVRKAHFGTIYNAIPYTFYQREDVMVFGIKDDLLQRRLSEVSTHSASFVAEPAYLERL